VGLHGCAGWKAVVAAGDERMSVDRAIVLMVEMLCCVDVSTMLIYEAKHWNFPLLCGDGVDVVATANLVRD
jgi:hypothetical protein